jgi:hypothetical protein
MVVFGLNWRALAYCERCSGRKSQIRKSSSDHAVLLQNITRLDRLPCYGFRYEVLSEAQRSMNCLSGGQLVRRVRERC